MNRGLKWMMLVWVFLCVVCFSSGEVRAEGVVRIDANKKYKGMNASFARGYLPSVKKNAMQLVIPFRAGEELPEEKLLVGVAFEREENSPFLFRNYQKQVKKSKGGVYLYKCKIRLRGDRVNGQYPLLLYVLAKTKEGMVREEFTVYVEISDGRAAFETEAGETSGEDGLLGEKKEEGKDEDAKEEIVRQPRILMEQNDLQGKEVLAGDSKAWGLVARNCSDSQEIQNMKVTVSTENKEISFEKNAWYFARVAARGTMDLSQNISVGKKALAEAVPVLFQFEYEDKKGTAYAATETVYLSVCQTQRAELVNFVMPESFYESDTNAVAFQVQNTGLAVIYNAKVRLEGQGLFAGEAFLGNMEAGMSLDGEMQIFAGTKDMDANGEIVDENEEKYGDVSGRVIFSYENEEGEVTEQVQEFSTVILKPETVELKIEEEEPETNQWWVTIVILVGFVLLLVIVILYLRMKHYQRMGRERYEKA